MTGTGPMETAEQRKVFRPIAIHARISSGCNLACSFCERELLGPGTPKKPGIIVFSDQRPHLDLSADMSEEVWEAIVQKLMPFTENMELGGLGEPTIAKLFPRAARDVIAAGKNLFFFTNGHTLGSRKVIDALRGGKIRISVSIDAGTPEVYRAVRGGDLDRVVRAIERFKAEIPDAVLCSQFTATLDNIRDLPAFVELCAKLGIGRFDEGGEIIVVGAQHHVTDRASKSVRFARSVTLAALEEAVRIAQENRLMLISRLPAFSSAAPDGAVDGSDPTVFRRTFDRLYGDPPCWIGTTGYDVGTETPDPPPGSDGDDDSYGAGVIDPRHAVTWSPSRMYVDHTGEVWSCLARHKLGHVLENTYAELVDENAFYQGLLGYYAGHLADMPDVCRACPNLA